MNLPVYGGLILAGTELPLIGKRFAISRSVIRLRFT